MGCLLRVFVGVVLTAAAVSGTWSLLKPNEYTEMDWTVGDCARFAGNWGPYFHQVDCDDAHDFELVGTAEMPGGFRCGAKDCYYGADNRSLAGTAAAACEPVALKYARLLKLPFGVEANARSSVGTARRAFGQPFPVWCEVRPLGTGPLERRLAEMG